MHPPYMSDRKVILVIGASGAQGRAVITELLKPGSDGSPSPWAVRAFTRNPDSENIKKLQALGDGHVEVAKGLLYLLNITTIQLKLLVI